ncbi:MULTISPECIES: VOC family protein [unclassified Empedobacter]|uniref:VOC family protein n=1 Tax=unclassified Empedobacter TaxID=2643773 RepID=UPI0025BA6A0A|nr:MULTISPECIES: VOC family protein [unclassified Empedobacter]
MKIRELQLFTNELEKTKSFYTTILAFDLIEETENQFSLQVGWTRLTFIKSDEEYIYHFSFLVCKNQFEKAFDWIQNKTKILNTNTDQHIANFENWNAQSFYFYDGSRNLAEMITHYNLAYENDAEFDQHSILGISEIGLPTTDIEATNLVLEEKTTSKFWKGDFETFGTNGSDEGKILLPNYFIKTTWFPTTDTITPTPFTAILENENCYSKVIFNNNKLNISNLAIL